MKVLEYLHALAGSKHAWEPARFYIVVAVVAILPRRCFLLLLAMESLVSTALNADSNEMN